MTPPDSAQQPDTRIQHTLPALQLFSVQRELRHDAKACIRQISELGFKKVEGFDLTQINEIKPFLDEFGLEVCGSFILWSHITGRLDLARKIQYPWLPAKCGIEYEIEKAQRLGIHTLTFGYLLPEERKCLEDFKRLAEQLNTAGEKCANEGLNLLYHNHGFEFEPTPEGVIPYSYLVDHTNPQYLNFELDVFWAKMVGMDPVKLMQRLGSRLKNIHLKTGVYDDIPEYDDQIVPDINFDYPLGTGIVDIESVLNTAVKQTNIQTVIEQDYSNDIFSSLEKSLVFYKTWAAK